MTTSSDALSIRKRQLVLPSEFGVDNCVFSANTNRSGGCADEGVAVEIYDLSDGDEDDWL